MRILTPLGHYLSRKRHARGFGIHSPFAFSFVQKVIGEKSGYYAYGIIESQRNEERLRGAGVMPLRHLKLIFRVVNFFRPEKIFIAGTIGNDLFPAILEPDSRIRLQMLIQHLDYSGVYSERMTATAGLPRELDRGILITGNTEGEKLQAASETVRAAVKAGIPIIMLHTGSDSGRKLLNICASAMSRGMIFHNDRSLAIAVPYSYLPRQDFRVTF